MSTRRQLNKDRVLHTAAELAEECGGVEELTLSALAGELGVRAPSLYNHVDGLRGLRGDLALFAGEMLLADVRQAAFGKTGTEALVAMGRAYRAFAHAHPALYPLTTVAPDPDETARVALAQEWLQLLLLTMASVGIEGENALHAIRAYRALLHGFVSLETGGGYKMALDLDESFERLLAMFVSGLARGEEVADR
ncbi:MAG: TetR/AcrR family transcriptional regulator [Candidatus Promineifilaceae bacterium]